MSKIQVDAVEQQSGTTVTVGGGACKTVTVDATTVTLGRSGGTVSLAPGASQTGFGRTGTVNWCTTAKTSPFTATSGSGFFVNTTSGGITVTLPSSPSAGDIIAVADYANTWGSNNVILCRNSSLINGGDSNATLNTVGLSATLVYVDGTRGWKQVNDATENVTGTPLFINATGGTITTCGNFKIHTFTSSSTFTINSAPTPANNNVSYMVVAGGGGGGGNRGGGGGAGGFREGETPAAPYTGSPLKNCAGLPVSVQAYPITVGAGGAGQPGNATGIKGSDSVFSTITSTGGGYGADDDVVGGPGGSGGGGGGGGSFAGGSGNDPSVSPPQGNNGASSASDGRGNQGAGGGGATAAGTVNTTSPAGGTGGAGATSSITGSPVARAGGGGAGGVPGVACGSAGGTGGGGTGNPRVAGGGTPTAAGTANTGGGGGGGGESPTASNNLGGTGGSGIVVIRYKFQ
jgi:hypothetical protein